jgi:hypothetical protein
MDNPPPTDFEGLLCEDVSAEEIKHTTSVNKHRAKGKAWASPRKNNKENFDVEMS